MFCMKNKFLILSLAAAAIFFSCAKKDTVTTVSDPSFTEDFDTLSKAVGRGWVIANNSKPIGTLPWVQGFNYLSIHHEYDGKLGATNTGQLGGFSGVAVSASGSDFVMATADCGHGRAVISNWLISPEIEIKNGDKITFYSRTVANPAVSADRLQVRVNTVDASANVGREANSTGNFSEVLLDINPEYALENDGSYPEAWTKFTATVSGMPGKTAKKSRVAFRYFVENGGPAGANSTGIGIDKFEFISVLGE
jgi:hypothetical protein